MKLLKSVIQRIVSFFASGKAEAAYNLAADLVPKALPIIREIVVTHKDENVAIVSHKATLRIILSSLLGFDVRGYRDRLDQAPACLNIVDFKDPVRARLMLFNDVSHYADRPLSPHEHLSKWWDANGTSKNE